MTVKGLKSFYENPYVKKVMRSILFVMLYLVGLMIFVFMIKKIGWANFFSAIKTANVYLVTCAVFFYLLSNFLRGAKWYIYYKDTYSNTGFVNLLLIYFSSNLINNMVPTRLGDLYSFTTLKTSNKYSLSKISSVFILDKSIEAIFMLLFSLISILFLILNGNYLQYEVPIIVVSAMLLLVGSLTFILITKKRLNHIMELKLFRRIPIKLRKRIETFVENFSYHFANVISDKLVFLVLITFVCWLLDFSSLYFAVNSISKVAFLHSIAAQCISIPISLLSFIPNGIGISSFSYVKVTGFFGYKAINVVTASIFSKLTFLIVLYILGLLSFCIYITQLKGFNKNTENESEN